MMVEVELLNWSGRESVKIVADACRMTADKLADVDDEKIIKMLVNNDYTSAIEHIWFTFKIRCSIACQRQILEHRIASHTTRSTRYCDESEFLYHIPEGLDEADANEYAKLMEHIRSCYKKLKEKYGNDVARYVLPMATMTEFVWTVNARSLLNFLGLRLCVRAHSEIREVAEKILEIVKRLVPEIFENAGCRGKMLGVCPENEARPKKCRYRGIIPTKNELAKKQERLYMCSSITVMR